MASKRKKTNDFVANSVANIADVAGPRSLGQQTYFEVIDDGINDWLHEEENVRSTPDGSGDGLSDPQRRVLAVALRRIVQAARKGRRLCVVASTDSVYGVMEQELMKKTLPRHIFRGWKQRMEKKPWQPVVTPSGEYLMVLRIEGSGSRREIRAGVAAGRPDGEAWKLSFVWEPLPPVEEEKEPITTAEHQPGTDPTVAAVAKSTYMVFRGHNPEVGESFRRWCAREHLLITAWLRRELRRRHLRAVETVQVVEVTRVIVSDGTDGALALSSGGGTVENDRLKAEPRHAARTAAENQSVRTLSQIASMDLPELERRNPAEDKA